MTLNAEEDTLTEDDADIHFATTNKGKFKEAREIVEPFGIRLKRLNLEKHEIQSDLVAEIAASAAQQLILTGKVHAVIAEDSGFFVDSLGGFPGPYSSYVHKTIGSEGILRLMRNVANRKASFTSAVAYRTTRRAPVCFTGIVKGTVMNRLRGKSGFGFDPIFAPQFGDGRTFAEMNVHEKNRYSHRAKAFMKFCEWYSTERRRAKVT
jgi:XTP/dITP diphosphohydrolase